MTMRKIGFLSLLSFFPDAWNQIPRPEKLKPGGGDRANAEIILRKGRGDCLATVNPCARDVAISGGLNASFAERQLFDSMKAAAKVP
jgi:hypothetical protein